MAGLGERFVGDSSAARRIRAVARLKAKSAPARRNQAELRRFGFVGASQRSNARAVQASAAAHGKEVARMAATLPFKGGQMTRAEGKKMLFARPANTTLSIPGAGYVGGQAREVAGALANAPGGVLQLGEAFAADLGHSIAHPTSKPTYGTQKALVKIGRAMLQQARHPVAHAGLDLLTLGSFAAPAASSLSRLSAGAKAARAGDIGGVARAVATRPAPAARIFEHQGLQVPGIYSRNKAWETLQKGSDVLRHRFPKVGLSSGPAITRNLPARIGFELARNRNILEGRDQAQALALAKKTKLSIRLRKRHGQQVAQTAARVQFEGVPIPERVAFHEAQGAATKSPLTKLRHGRQAGLLKQAAPLIENTPLGPRVAGTQGPLVRLMAQAAKVAGKREQTLGDLGRLVPAQVETRLHAPGRVILGARFEPKVGLAGAESFKAGQVRVPYTAPFERTPLGRVSLGSGKMIGVPRELASTTKAFKGGRLLQGSFRSDALRLIAEDALQAEKHAGKLRLRDQVLKASTDLKTGPHDIAVRTEAARNPAATQQVRALMATSEEGLLPGGRFRGGMQRAAAAHDRLRAITEAVFPSEVGGVKIGEIAPGAPESKIPGIRWVDERLLEGANRPPSFSAAATPGLRQLAAVGHGLNNATRLSLFYTAPKYFAPNILGNAALNFIHVGKGLPRAWSDGALLAHRLGPDTIPAVDEAMGSGIGQSIIQEGAKGPLGATTAKAAELWGYVLDRSFRRAAWAAEARRAGFATPEAQTALVHDIAHEADFVRVTRRARNEILDYERLGRFERSLSQFLFIYPFTKASTVYLGHFLTEHPVKAVAAAQLGVQGQDEVRKILGPIPSFAQGIIPFRGKSGKVSVSNPAAFTPLGPGLGVVGALAGAAAGKPTQADQLVQFFQPAVRAGLAAAQGFDPSTGRKVPGGFLGAFPQELARQSPQYKLIRGLLHPKAGHTDVIYPETRRSEVLDFLLGTMHPRPVNVAQLNKAGAKELAPDERLRFADKTFRRTMIESATAVGLGAGTKLSLPIRTALDWQLERNLARTAARASKGSALTPAEGIAADLNLLADQGIISKEAAAATIARNKTLTPRTLKHIANSLGLQYFGRSALDDALATINTARDKRGEKSLGRPALVR